MQSKTNHPPKSSTASSPLPFLTQPTSASPSPIPLYVSPTHPSSDPPSVLPIALQTHLDNMQLSTNLKIESLANTFAHRFDQLISLYHTSSPPTSLPHNSIPQSVRPPPVSFPLPTRLPHHPSTLPEFGSFRTPQLSLDMPKFDGQDPAGWIFRIEEYFEFYATSHDERLRLVGLCMEGQASKWLRWMRDNNLISSWGDFLSQVRVRFDPDHFEDYVGALSKLRQNTTVSAYQSDFERLLNKVTGVSDSTLISVFISGLKPPLRRELNLRRPSTLKMAFALERELSAMQSDTFTPSSTLKRLPWPITQPTTSALPVSSIPTTPPSSITSPPTTHPTTNIRRITAAEKNCQGRSGPLLLVRPKMVMFAPLPVTSAPHFQQ